MRFSFPIARAAVVVAALLVMSGCSWFGGKSSDTSAEYKNSGQTRPLDVPPGLTRPSQDESLSMPEAGSSGTAVYSQYADQRRRAPANAGPTVLPPQPGVRVEHDGDKYWLVIQGDADQVWPKIRDFWLQNGYLLSLDNPTIGIMETDWAEKHADVQQGVVRSFLNKALDAVSSSGVRNKFRVRLERGDKPNTTELYLTEYGMEETVEGPYSAAAEGSVWRPRPENHELEIEMLRRIMVSLGATKEHAKRAIAKAQPAATLGVSMVAGNGGAPALLVDESFSRAWRVTGLALDQIGFTVRDRDRARGIYFVRYEDPDKTPRKESFLSKLAFWKSSPKPVSDLYQVLLKSEAARTRITVQDKDGKPDTSGTGKRILTLLQEQLRK